MPDTAAGLPAHPASILVAPLARVHDVIRSHGARHLVSCMFDGGLAERPADIPVGRHLTLPMHDIEGPMQGYTPPAEAHVVDLVAVGQAWDQHAPLLVHCHAGVSRSTAAAFIAVCALNPQVSERVIARYLRQISPHAWPNRLFVSHADRVLHRRGRMVRAIDEIGPGILDGGNRPFVLPARIAAP